MNEEMFRRLFCFFLIYFFFIPKCFYYVKFFLLFKIVFGWEWLKIIDMFRVNIVHVHITYMTYIHVSIIAFIKTYLYKIQIKNP